MSRAFVKENDQEEIPVLPPRAYLPDGVINYVTPAGMDELLEEKQTLITEIEQLDIADDDKRRIAVNHINAKLQQLSDRILTAKIIDLNEQSEDEVWFGATITLRVDDEPELQKYKIVGVDEADASKGKISFISPIDKLLLGKEVGEKAILKHTKGEKTFEIVEIVY